MVTKTELEQNYIRKISRYPSKAEEIKFFEDIVCSIPKNSYLIDFFNQDCLYYIQRMINDDFCVDPEYFFESAVEKASEEVVRCKNKEIEELKAELQKTKNEMYEMARQRNDAVNKVEQLKKALS